MDNQNIEMIWIDLETTGLDANECIPLEVGLKLTDKYGFIIAERKWLVWERTPDWAIKMMEGAADKFVGPMHQKSGLWDDLIEKRGETLDREECDEQMCEFLDEYEVEYAQLGLTGSSIGSLDRPFALIHFPKFNAQAGYRNIDISTLKELCKRHNPILKENLDGILGTKEDSTHRVLADIDASILEYRAYLDNFLITED